MSYLGIGFELKTNKLNLTYFFLNKNFAIYLNTSLCRLL